MTDAAIAIDDDDWAELITAAGPLSGVELRALVCAVGAILDAVEPQPAVAPDGWSAPLQRLEQARFDLCALKLRLGEVALLVKLSRLCARQGLRLAAQLPDSAAAPRARALWAGLRHLVDPHPGSRIDARAPRAPPSRPPTTDRFPDPSQRIDRNPWRPSCPSHP